MRQNSWNARHISKYRNILRCVFSRLIKPSWVKWVTMPIFYSPGIGKRCSLTPKANWKTFVYQSVRQISDYCFSDFFFQNFQTFCKKVEIWARWLEYGPLNPFYSPGLDKAQKKYMFHYISTFWNMAHISRILSHQKFLRPYIGFPKNMQQKYIFDNFSSVTRIHSFPVCNIFFYVS